MSVILKSNLVLAFSIILFSIEDVYAKIDIKPGSKGFGLSCFKGTKIDTFWVEIVGIKERVLPKGDIILAKMSGKFIDETGVIAGMSGSPVYVDGKLIGAVAYKFGIFSKVPMCGITPISEIISPPELGYNISGAELIMPVTNLSPFACELFQKEFGKFAKIMPLEVGATYSDEELIPEPGAPLGILLVQGDVNLAIMGTCTFKDGSKVYGLGHPFLLLGKTNLPMTGGYVLDVLPSLASSFKFTSPGKIIGTVESDNSRGIIGTIGNLPKLIEFSISLDGHDYKYSITDELRLFHPIIEGLLLNVLAMGGKLLERLTLRYKVNIETHSHGKINYEDICIGDPIKGIRSLTEEITYLRKNEFDTVKITDLEIKLTSDPELKYGEIVDIIPQKEFVSRGEILPITVRVKTHKGNIIEFYKELNIPNWVLGNKVTIAASSCNEYIREIRATLQNIHELVKFYMERPRKTDILITIVQNDGKLVAPRLPSSISTLLDKETGTPVVEVLDTDWVIKGQASCKINLGE